MSIVQLTSYDIAVAQPWQLLSTTGFWASLPRLARQFPDAKLLMIADTLRPEEVLAEFARLAVPESELPPEMRFYRMQYEDFLRQTLDEVRYIRSYLVVDTSLDDEALCHLLAGYGVAARPLDHALPLPFAEARDLWTHVQADDGRRFALLRTRNNQFGAIYARSLHRLFGLDFPLWACLSIHTFGEREATKTLRLKALSARFAPRKTDEQVEEASEVEGTVGRLRAEMNRVGAALHTVQLHVLVGADDDQALATRREIVRGALSLEMQNVIPAGEAIRQVFNARAEITGEGCPLTSPGVALLVGSALSYRRRTETRGVFLGIDRNQAPVIFDPFDPRNPSFNMAVIGQTGSGKTFAVLCLMLRMLQLGTQLILVDPQGNIDLGWLGPELYHRAKLGTETAAINILDIHHDEIATQVESVLSMLSLLGVLRRGDALSRSILDEILLDIYQPIWNTNTPAPTLDAIQRRLKLLAKTAELESVRLEAANLAYMLNPYTTGSYAALFGRPTTVDFSLSRAVTVYDVSGLPQQELGGSLRAALLSILVADVNQAIRRKRLAGDATPILFFVDEIGVLMRDPVIASHVSREYKTARSRRVGMIVADQTLNSLLGPADERGLHHGVEMLANAAFRFLFFQEDSERERVRASFPGLPEALFSAIFTFPRGVCLAQLPDDLLVVSVRPSALERTVLSSQLADKARAAELVARLRRQFGLAA